MRRPAWWLFLLLAFPWSGNVLIGGERRDIDIPRGEAGMTLTALSEQMDLQVIYRPEQLDGVVTSEVHGSYLPHEALDRMLKGTRLVAVPDRDSGAYAIVSRGDAQSTAFSINKTDTPETDPVPEDEDAIPQAPMQNKKSLIQRLIAPLIAFGAVTPSVPAQEGDPTFELEEFSVYASATESANIKKRESDIIGSFLDSDALGELPDDDLGEALTRLAGVNVVGGQGTQAAEVTIRGAEGRHNSVRINGADIVNAGIGDRNYDVSQIPAEMVQSVTVVKSVTAEYPADSIGGMVNVETATGLSFPEGMMRYKGEYRFRDQNDEDGYGFNLVYGDTIGSSERLGVFLNLNHVNEDIRTWDVQYRFRNDPPEPGEPDVVPIMDRFDPNEQLIRKVATTFNASIDYKVSDATTLYFRPWIQFSGHDRDEWSTRVDQFGRLGGNYWFLDDAGNPLGDWEDTDGDGILGSADDTFVRATDADGNEIQTPGFENSNRGRFQRIASDFEIDGETYSFDFGGHTMLSEGSLKYRLMIGRDQRDTFSREWRFLENFDGDESPNYLRTRVTGLDTVFPEFVIYEVTDPKGHIPVNADTPNMIGDLNRSFTDTSPRFRVEDVQEDLLLGSVDYITRLTDRLQLKTGVRYQDRKRDNTVTQLFFAPTENRSSFPAGQFATPGNTLGSTTLFDDRYSYFGAFPLASGMFDTFFDDLAMNPGNWEFVRTDFRDMADTAELNETVSAAYLQSTYKLGELSLIAGLRVEHTELDTIWKPSSFRIDGGDIPGKQAADFGGLIPDLVIGDYIDDIEETKDYTNWLPSLLGVWRVGNTGHVFRAAFTSTLSRPDYQELIPFDLSQAREVFGRDLSPMGDDFAIGNPGLNEQTSRNYDLAWEYYFGKDDENSLSVTAFRKDMEDFLLRNQFDRIVMAPTDPTDPNSPLEESEGTVSFYSNGSERTIEGLEVSWYQDLDDILPHSLRGLGFLANYTYITGDQSEPIYDPDELQNGNFVQTGVATNQGLTNQPENIVNLQMFLARGRLNMRVSYNYVDQLRRTASSAEISDATFDREQERVDLSIQYLINRQHRLRLFFEVDNLTDEVLDARFIGANPDRFVTSYQTIGRRFVVGVRGSM